MGNSVSALMREIEDIHAQKRTDILGVGPPPAEGVQAVVKDARDVYTEISDLYSDFTNAWTGAGLDDRHMLLEKVLTWMAQNPDSPIEHKLESIVITFLYKDLPHPPAGYLSVPDEAAHPTKRKHQAWPYAFRPADGSDYNVLWPALGQARRPYARSVPATHPLPAAALPDPGLVFDMLMRRDKFEPHPAGVSSLFFAFADLVIHSIFNTDHADPTQNNASSYLDLSPLYGSSDAELDRIRRKDGTGRLFEDVFADGRLLFMPPSVCALLVLFCRNHNYIASQILAINENNTYTAPSSLDPERKTAQDDELFARARLVNCAAFMQVILGDYVGAILGLARDGHSWRLKILDAYRDADHSVAPRGEGNVVSVEFNLMYRWHAAISDPDTKWLEQELGGMFPGRDLATLTRADLGKAYARAERGAKDVKGWSFGGLKRDASGRFADGDLARVIQDATDASAGAFRARGVPAAMKFIELMAIEQARRWGTCSLNEFRRFMGLKPYATFEEWNPDEEIANAARLLYHDIENLELYVGMVAEEAKAPQPGAGLCPGYTLSRAILSDAVCLVRGDRFLTTELTPQNLTAWGYADVQLDPTDGSYGGMLTKLLFRTLPARFPARSAYAHFPFLVPALFKPQMEERDPASAALYEWERPSAVEAQAEERFPRSEEEVMKRVREIAGEDYKVDVLEDLVFKPAALETHARSFARFADAQIRKESLGRGTKYVDVVRDVVNLVPVYWVAALIRPRIENDDPAHHHHRGYHPETYFAAFGDLAEYLYINTSASSAFSLRTRAQALADSIIRHIASGSALVHAQHSPDIITRIARRALAAFPSLIAPSPVDVLDSDAPPCEVPDDAEFLEFLETLRSEDGRGSAVGFVAQLAGTAAVYARCVARVVDWIFERPEVLARLTAKPSDEDLVSVVREAMKEVNETGVTHGMMDPRFVEATAPAILRAIFSLPAVRRAPGVSGHMHSITEKVEGAPAVNVALYVNAKGGVGPWPSSLTLQYDPVAE